MSTVSDLPRRWKDQVRKLLKETRAAADMSINDVAERLNIHPRTAWRFERGETEPSGDDIDHWMKVTKHKASIDVETKDKK